MAEIQVRQGEIKPAQLGDVVLNAGTTTCGLVMGYMADEQIICYHWPFFCVVDQKDAKKFEDAIGAHPTRLRQIVIVTHPTEELEKDYLKVIATFITRYNVPIRYYRTDVTTGMSHIDVLLTKDGVDVEYHRIHRTRLYAQNNYLALYE